MSRPRFPKRPQDVITRAGALNGAALPDLPRRVADLERSHRATVPACRVYRTAALSHTSTGAFQAITWDSESFDTDGMFTASSSTLVVKTPGLYLITGVLHFAANATGVRYIDIYTNGSVCHRVQTEQTASGSFLAGRHATTVQPLAAGDTIGLAGFQNTGGNLAYNAGDAYMNLQAVWICRTS